ncbi:2-amino-4-hydroxy-6-hydroxymethyldihydropteridine diphosphokinase [Alkalihalobacillus pseudalcaliphilus]|uniref:2-amino-4-hydroxy-6- hydroxymethyldihydropteridine diphosphokinase n=1 Tax=Alkalihalobacillus pseudalcaliphilus TaxID=79884 RepID=UPI00064DDCA3|nr:2-amino-4-hydroxy-6-hydroxymethyldihydropteridine diphosphokinase [Alkalihalobacillus pseudalcaliphilus]KMK74522.1 2-amino-4-hydroxy-6-hydroxymethyldihydropteridine pyrophosphokinase [Alkalihalobacillus pseudalcaliphilus]
MGNQAFIALGSNMGIREEYLRKAIQLLKEHPHIEVCRESNIYETVPVGYVEQAAFLNMVIEVKTALSPVPLLAVTQSIELECGRTREVRFGPRTLDLDILLYAEEEMKKEGLIIPHPRMHERAFVMVPLSELVPERLLLNVHQTVKEIAQSLPDREDVKLWIPN